MNKNNTNLNFPSYENLEDSIDYKQIDPGINLIEQSLIPLSASRSFNRKAKTEKKYSTEYSDNNDGIPSDTLVRSTKEFIEDSLNHNAAHRYYTSKNSDKAHASGADTSHSLYLIKYKKTYDKCDTDQSAHNLNQQQKKREVYSLVLFIFFLFVTIITLSQILVMHNQTHSSNFGQIKLMQDELKLMDATIDTMLKERRVLPMEVWYAMKQYDENLKRFSQFLDDTDAMKSNAEITTNDAFSHNYTDLISHLNKCENFTNHLLDTLNSTSSQSKSRAYLIYKVLANLLSKENMIADSNLNFTNEINIALKVSLKKITLIPNHFQSPESFGQHKNCLHSVTVGLFYLFSQQYTRFFETEPKFRDILVDRYDLINKTLTKFDVNNKLNGINLLKKPLRNMNEFHDKYKKRNFKLNTNNSLCEPQPPNLLGPLHVVDNHNITKNNMTKSKIEKDNSEVKMGGQWSPQCQARHKIAIIIPYRDRYEHLLTLLSYLHPLLQRQQLDYKIYVTEQYGNGTFNKAIIMNAAFIYAFDQDNFNCYCFHDVDLVPEDDRNMYSCGNNPKHLSIGVDEMNYKLQYEELIGGVLILNTEHLIASNGYSNLYWGWGAEDDDLYYRLKGLSYKVERPPLKIGRYKMMKHQKRTPQLWSKRAKLLYSSVNRMKWDGISSANYTILKVTENKLYTHLMIDVGLPPAGFN